MIWLGGVGEHRGKFLVQFAYKGNDFEPWHIRGVRCCLVQFFDNTWWIVANAKNDDARFSDDGPYETKELAAVSATLQEQK